MKWNIENGFTHILQVLDHLNDRLAEFDYLSCTSSLNPDNRSGILKVDVLDGDFMSLGKFLATNRISITAREGGIRIAPHVYNTKGDIDLLLDKIRMWKNS